MLVASESIIPARLRARTPIRLLAPPPQHCEHFLAIVPTAWGVCGAVWRYPHEISAPHARPFGVQPAGALLCRILPPGLAVAEVRRCLLLSHGPCNEVFGDGAGTFHPEVVPDWFPELVRFLQSYYANARHEGPAQMNQWSFWKPRLDWTSLTPFQQQVLAIVANIPHAARWTYGQVAGKVGNPRAGRAVGAALKNNPWPVLVPCHRVVGSRGNLTGFSAPGGVSAKLRMLALEADGPLFQ